jgi:curli biogenesis system outer membrane secretion channel CsgG
MRFARISICVASSVLTGVLLSGEPQEVRKKRLAVVDFEYGTVRSDVSQMFGSEFDIGRGMAALLVKHLVKDGTYTVVEPRLMQALSSQQGQSGDSRTDLAAAAQVGRMLGVDAIVLGTIVQFGTPHTKAMGAGGGAMGGSTGRGYGGKEKRKAIVSVTARVLDVETGDVVTVADGVGQSARSSASFGGYGIGSGGFGFGGVDFTTSGFLETVIGEATEASIANLSQELIAASGAVGKRRRAVEGLVAQVKGTTVVLNVGWNAGVRAGDVLTLERVADVVRDPATGDVIRRITEKVGELRVTESDAISAECEAVGGIEVKVGDMAKRAGT